MPLVWIMHPIDYSGVVISIYICVFSNILKISFHPPSRQEFSIAIIDDFWTLFGIEIWPIATTNDSKGIAWHLLMMETNSVHFSFSAQTVQGQLVVALPVQPLPPHKLSSWHSLSLKLCPCISLLNIGILGIFQNCPAEKVEAPVTWSYLWINHCSNGCTVGQQHQQKNLRPLAPWLLCCCWT